MGNGIDVLPDQIEKGEVEKKEEGLPVQDGQDWVHVVARELGTRERSDTDLHPGNTYVPKVRERLTVPYNFQYNFIDFT